MIRKKDNFFNHALYYSFLKPIIQHMIKARTHSLKFVPLTEKRRNGEFL